MRRKGDTLTAYLFLSPALIVFCFLILYPIVFSLIISFSSWKYTSGLSGVVFNGITNYQKLLTDRTFGYAVSNTFVYVLAIVPASLAISLVLAYILNHKVYMSRLLRMFFFIPYISNIVALSALFKYLFKNDGPINMVLQNVFFVQDLPKWLASSDYNKVPIILLLIWTSIGYEMVIYMAALQNVPASLYEAAEVDGANRAQQFLKITLPMISQTTFYLIVIRMIAIFKIFASVNIINYKNMARGNTSIVQVVYENAFTNYKFGYASAQAWVLVLMVLIITLAQFMIQKKWTHS